MFSHQRFFRISYVSNFPNNCKAESLRVKENNNVLKFLGWRSLTYIFKKENNLVLLYKKLVHKQFQRISDLFSNCLNLICYSLRAAVCKYREFAVKTEISKSFIFSQKKPFGETFSKITIKVSKEFSFSRKPAKSEMLPHAI